MAFETREGQGALFRNDRKEKHDQPDYQGQLRVGGLLFRIVGWRRESKKSGTPWLSLSIKPDERENAQAPRAAPAAPARSTQQAATQGAARAPHEFNDDIPF